MLESSIEIARQWINKGTIVITKTKDGITDIRKAKNRALTNRERARLQTFPDEFVFHGSKESVRRQIGMAVPVEGARIILEAILKTFAKIEYAFIESSFLTKKSHNIVKFNQSDDDEIIPEAG